MDADYAIILREAIYRKGAAAFTHGRHPSSHGFNHGAAAIQVFLDGFNDAAAKANSTPANGGRVELAQGGQP